MYNFVIFCRFSLLYIAGAEVEAYAKANILILLYIKVTSTGIFVGWFDLAKSC